MKHNNKLIYKRCFSFILAFVMLFGTVTALVSCNDSGTGTTSPDTTVDGTASKTPINTQADGTTSVVVTPTVPVFTAPAEFEDVAEPGIYVEYYNFWRARFW